MVGKKAQHKATREGCEIRQGSSASGATEKARKMPWCCAVWEGRDGDEGTGLPARMGGLAGLPCSVPAMGSPVLASGSVLRQMVSATYWVTF